MWSAYRPEDIQGVQPYYIIHSMIHNTIQCVQGGDAKNVTVYSTSQNKKKSLCAWKLYSWN